MTRKPARETVALPTPTVEPRAGRLLVFVSHDSRDADLAEAFENLLTDASGGVLRAFRSSDRKGFSGIEFGAEWYSTIMEKLSEASDVVALLTPNSLERPWILYEVGVARGTLRVPALGVLFGVPLARIQGPFAQFQNSGDDVDSLTKLLIQLIQRNPDASPRKEAVRRQVIAFRESLSALVRPLADAPSTDVSPDATSVAKLFEEVKVMFRELTVLAQGQSEQQRGSELQVNVPRITHLFNDLVSGVEVGLRRLAVHNIRVLYPDLSAAVAARVISQSSAQKRLTGLAFSEVRDILRELVRNGESATKLPRDEDLDRLSTVIQVRHRLAQGERVNMEELTRAFGDLMHFVNGNARLMFDNTSLSS